MATVAGEVRHRARLTPRASDQGKALLRARGLRRLGLRHDLSVHQILNLMPGVN